MAAIVSASPVPVHSYSLETRRHPARTTLRTAASRSRMRPSPRANDIHQSWPRPSDSSDDDDDLAPIKLSAEAQAILGEESSQAQSDKENVEPQRHGMRSTHHADMPHHEHWSPRHQDGSPAPRVVRVPAPSRPMPPSVLERDGSFAYKIHDKSKTFGALERGSRTPAQPLRKVRVSGSRSQTKSPSSEERAERGAQQPERTPVREDCEHRPTTHKSRAVA